jgi:hypothetical protein
MLQTANSVNTRALWEVAERVPCPFAQVLEKIGHSSAGDFYAGHTVAPPTLIIRARQLDAARHPECNVVMNNAALLKFGDPAVTARDGITAAPLTNMRHESADVLGFPVIISACVGQRDHEALVRAVAAFRDTMTTRSKADSATQTRKARQYLVGNKCIGLALCERYQVRITFVT